LREGEEGKGGACEGEEAADVLGAVAFMSYIWMYAGLGKASDLFYSAEVMYLAGCAR
jgi:hypothetical protein